MQELNSYIREGNFIKQRKRYLTLSANAKSLIEGLMHKEVGKRLTA